jgi:hypothetical protein
MEPVRELPPKQPKGLPSWFVLSAGGILLLGGMVKVLDFFAKAPAPDMADPIFALPFHDLMLWVGLAELAVACLCLFTSKRTLSLGLLAWLVVTLTAYRIGLWTMGWHHPYAWVAGLVNGLDISPWVADLMIGATSAYLLVGSMAMLWFERRTAQAAQSLKMSCPTCGGHIKFAIQNLGQQIPCPHCQAAITLRKSDLLKITCYFCKEHIEFPAHALGQKVSCPHCKKEITLKEPA